MSRKSIEFKTPGRRTKGESSAQDRAVEPRPTKSQPSMEPAPEGSASRFEANAARKADAWVETGSAGLAVQAKDAAEQVRAADAWVANGRVEEPQAAARAEAELPPAADDWVAGRAADRAEARQAKAKGKPAAAAARAAGKPRKAAKATSARKKTAPKPKVATPAPPKPKPARAAPLVPEPPSPAPSPPAPSAHAADPTPKPPKGSPEPPAPRPVAEVRPPHGPQEDKRPPAADALPALAGDASGEARADGQGATADRPPAKAVHGRHKTFDTIALTGAVAALFVAVVALAVVLSTSDAPVIEPRITPLQAKLSDLGRSLQEVETKLRAGDTQQIENLLQDARTELGDLKARIAERSPASPGGEGQTVVTVESAFATLDRGDPLPRREKRDDDVQAEVTRWIDQTWSDSGVDAVVDDVSDFFGGLLGDGGAP